VKSHESSHDLNQDAIVALRNHECDGVLELVATATMLLRDKSLCDIQVVGRNLNANTMGWVTNRASTCIRIEISAVLQDLKYMGIINELSHKWLTPAHCHVEDYEVPQEGPLEIRHMAGVFLSFLIATVASVACAIYDGKLCKEHPFRNKSDEGLEAEQENEVQRLTRTNEHLATALFRLSGAAQLAPLETRVQAATESSFGEYDEGTGFIESAEKVSELTVFLLLDLGLCVEPHTALHKIRSIQESLKIHDNGGGGVHVSKDAFVAMFCSMFGSGDHSVVTSGGGDTTVGLSIVADAHIYPARNFVEMNEDLDEGRIRLCGSPIGPTMWN